MNKTDYTLFRPRLAFRMLPRSPRLVSAAWKPKSSFLGWNFISPERSPSSHEFFLLNRVYYLLKSRPNAQNPKTAWNRLVCLCLRLCLRLRLRLVRRMDSLEFCASFPASMVRRNHRRMAWFFFFWTPTRNPSAAMCSCARFTALFSILQFTPSIWFHFSSWLLI